MKAHLLVWGGGVIGLSVAYECARRGFAVTLVERGACGGQASGAAAGMLAPFAENAEGADDFFRFCVDSLRRFPAWADDVAKSSGVVFEYGRPGSLLVAFHDADLLALETRRAWQAEYGAAPELVEGAALRRLEPNLSGAARAALFHPEESHVYAPDYVRALEAACRAEGVRIRDRAGEAKLVSDSGAMRPSGGVRLADAAGNVYEGDRLVVCTGAWSGLSGDAFALTVPVFPIRGQICAFRAERPGDVRHLVFTSQGYVVPKANGTIVCGASEDMAGFSTDVTEDGIARLRGWSRRLYPFLGEREPVHAWAGLRPATRDGFPLLGALASDPRVVFATGHYRNGILLSPATAAAVADVLEGKPTRTAIDAFAPERFTPSPKRPRSVAT